MRGAISTSSLEQTAAAIFSEAASKALSLLRPEAEVKLPEWLARYRADPVAYVLEVFPWGKPGPLEKHAGPDAWQLEILERIRDGLLTVGQAIQLAISSGHGVGKSALVAWIVCWSIDTQVDCRGVVTANTEAQLKGKTWAELAKWFRIGGLGERFDLTATALISRLPGHDRTWRVDQVTWSEIKPEGFAGLHNEGRRVLIVFDEASAIPEIIWETAEGALTDQETEIIFLALGNPTRNSGRFYKVCFGSLRHRWITRTVDARTCRLPNKEQIAQWEADYGEDSDFFRIRVRGVAPRSSDMQFIPSDVVLAARKREASWTWEDPLIMAIDFARGGADKTVVGWRRGLNATIRKWLKIPGSECRDTMRVVSLVVEQATEARPDAIFGDATGIGGPALDRLRQLGYPVFDVQFGGEAHNNRRYANKGTEIWQRMKDWLSWGQIPDDESLDADLTTREYDHDKKDRLILESKADMTARGLASPDEADALAMTFAIPVAPRSTSREHAARGSVASGSDYDPMKDI